MVYTQVVDYPTTEETERHARALIDQWGVGRKGFDDGLAIFFDFEPGRSSRAGPALRRARVRRHVPDQQRTPADLRERHAPAPSRGRLGRGDPRRHGSRIDEVATPRTPLGSSSGRQLNAVVGLVGAPLVLAGLVGWAFFHWRRYGKDPVYLDSPSIYVPAPPPDLTAASGAMVMDGGTSRRALTTAMLDLASRGLIAFREETGLLGLVEEGRHRDRPDAGDPWSRRSASGTADVRSARRSSSRSGGCAARQGRATTSSPTSCSGSAPPSTTSTAALEKHVVGQRLVRARRPARSTNRWRIRGVPAAGAGAILAWSSGSTDPDGRACARGRGGDRRRDRVF